ncbi:MAG: hypothetical protein IKH31_02005 [Clostridia bacterium]|nr:hypothetical protein [Clostridia bacterium]
MSIMEIGLPKAILMIVVPFIVLYGLICILTIPDNRHDEEDYINLPAPLRYILFLPLAIGKCRSYLILGVFSQISLFLSPIAIFLVMHLVDKGVIAAENEDNYILLMFLILPLIGMIVHLLRRIVRPRTRYPRSHRRKRMKSRRMGRRRRF